MRGLETRNRQNQEMGQLTCGRRSPWTERPTALIGVGGIAMCMGRVGMGVGMRVRVHPRMRGGRGEGG